MNAEHNLLLPVRKTNGFRISARTVMSVFIFITVVMIGARIQDVTHDILSGDRIQGVSPAKAETTDKQTDKPASAKSGEMAGKESKENKKEEPTGTTKEGEAGKDMANEEKPDPINTDPSPQSDQENYSEAEVNILKRLSERRQELDKRARDMDQREALLKITEQRIDKKLGDLKTMQEQVRQAISTATAEQKAKTDSLVKIYEIMKPKDAAHIFDALDLPVLLSVIANMKESRVAPILAAMDAQKAKQVTSALMEKKPLPAPP